MHSKGNPKFILKILTSNGSLLILGGLTVWLGVLVAKEAYRKHEVRQEIARLKADIVQTQKKNDNLTSILDSLEDPSTVELEAKKRLNLQKPGEEVAVILRDTNDESQNIIESNNIDTGYADEGGRNQDVTDEAGKKLANPIKWWKYITDQ